MKNSVLIMPSLCAISCALLSCATPQSPANRPPIVVVYPNGAPVPPPTPTVQQTVQTVPTRVIVTAPTTPPAPPPPSIVTVPTPAPISSARHYAHFYDWKNDFIQRMSARYGYAAEQLFANASLNNQVIKLDGNQAEFAKMPWEYLDSAVSANRVSQGQAKRREMLQTLNAAENRYGVPASIVTAIWGLESSFGEGMGSTDLVNALSSLAYDGRRRDFAENQLAAMLQLVQRGDVSASQLQGSWAGGMGHTQFIPSTWLAEGVDGDNDGRKNPFSRADALTSTASYLANAGWVRDLPAYIEIQLPNHFDYRYLGTKQTLDTWRNLGVQGINPNVSGYETAELFLPAGIHGPKLLTTRNFDAIKVYNNSSNYALAVATLAQRLNGGVGIKASFPREARALSRNQVQTLQRNLTRQGFDTKGTDGVVGSNTRKAFALWQGANGQIPDGFISLQTAQPLLY